MSNYFIEIRNYYEEGLKKIRTIINKKVVVSLNWPYILVFVFFWSYGYQAAIALNSSLFQLGLSAYLVSITAYFLFLGARKKELFTSKFTFLIKDILVLGVMVAFWTTIAFDKLTQPVNGDHFYHGLGAIKHEFFQLESLTNL